MYLNTLLFITHKAEKLNKNVAVSKNKQLRNTMSEKNLITVFSNISFNNVFLYHQH